MQSHIYVHNYFEKKICISKCNNGRNSTLIQVGAALLSRRDSEFHVKSL